MLIAEVVVRQGHTVRSTEKLVASHFASQGAAKPTRSGGDGSRHAGLRLLPEPPEPPPATPGHARVLQPGEKHGRIEIEYYGKDDLQRILDLIGLGSE